MATFFRSSVVWVVDWRYDGRERRWTLALPEGVDPAAEMAARLQSLHGRRARLVGVRRATEDEERQYLRGEVPPNVFCPTGRPPAARPDAPDADEPQ